MNYGFLDPTPRDSNMIGFGARIENKTKTKLRKNPNTSGGYFSSSVGLMRVWSDEEVHLEVRLNCQAKEGSVKP